MGKYTYLFFLKWKRGNMMKLGGREYYDNTWKPKLLELCKEYGVKLLKSTTPFGTVEQDLKIFDTDITPDEFNEFASAIFNIDEKDILDYSKTTVCHNN